MGNPFHTYAGVLDRSSHLVHGYLPNDPMVVGYQVYGQETVDGAYGNPAASGVLGSGSVAMFEVSRGNTLRSPTITRKGVGWVEESRRGTTHFVFDVDDYLAAGVAIPPDDNWMFLRVQENRVGVGLLEMVGAIPVLGPVYCVPPPRCYGIPKPTFTLQGIAPSAVVGVAAGAPAPFDLDLTTAAPRPLVLVLPVPMSEFTLVNLDGVETLLVSFGPDQVMQAVPPGGNVQLKSGSTKTLVLACPGAGGCPYALHGVLGRG